MLASTHQRTLNVVPLKAIREHAIASRDDTLFEARGHDTH
jgi:hypothetical protein